MERLISICSLIILSLLLSCDKGAGEFIICGEVSDDTFNQYLIGANISIYKVPVASSSEQYISSQTIGSDGKYRFIVPRERMEKYIIRVTKSNYFPIEKTIYFSALKLKVENTYNLSTWAKSWVELKFVNQNPQIQDHLAYIKQAGDTACLECCPSTEQHLYGAIDTSIFCINKGNTLYSILYWVMNTTNQGYLETTTTAFDTTQIYLNY